MSERDSESSSSESERPDDRARALSDTSQTSMSVVNARTTSPTNTIDGPSIADTATARGGSPTASHVSAVTNTTSTSQQPTVAGGIPIIGPPGFNQQTGTGIGVFGPQRPTGYPTQPPTTTSTQQPIKIDVAAAQQQYQQRGAQPEISPYSGSTTSSSAGSLSSPGTASIQQQQQQQQPVRYDTNRSTASQQDLNRSIPTTRGQTGQQAQTGATQMNTQQRQQQAQFANAIPAHQVYNELLGPDAFKDVILDIDYGALGGYNAAFQSGGDFSGGQLPPGISIRPAYNTVDSLSYQQHMFNTARTIHAGAESQNYDYGGMSSSYNFGGTGGAYDVNAGGQLFDAAKAIFNQVDTNHDGTISREEFRSWVQPGQQNYGGQSYATTTNYQASATNTSNASDPLYHASLFAGADPTVANILQQSGLGQVVPN